MTLLGRWESFAYVFPAEHRVHNVRCGRRSPRQTIRDEPDIIDETLPTVAELELLTLLVCMLGSSLIAEVSSLLRLAEREERDTGAGGEDFSGDCGPRSFPR